MSEVIAPTSKELFDAARMDNHDIVSVQREIEPRKGRTFYVSEVFHRKTDDTFWMVNYVDSDQDPYYELKSCSDISRVEKYERTIVDYRAV